LTQRKTAHQVRQDLTWIVSLLAVAQELVDSSATDETSPSDGSVDTGIAFLKIYRITTTNVAMNIDENITRSTWEPGYKISNKVPIRRHFTLK